MSPSNFFSLNIIARFFDWNSGEKGTTHQKITMVLYGSVVVLDISVAN